MNATMTGHKTSHNFCSERHRTNTFPSMSKFSEYLKRTVSMSDQIDKEAASRSIKKNISFKGSTIIILACAIIIASIGLNVNSIPVIIGAMLISPLMSPIIGFGLGLGTNDTDLIRDSLKNLCVMVVISLLASTAYFIITPLHLEHPTELLARTNPTIYDVMIAFVGGLAGMLETCRKERGTVLSGVAIATALMPPLCTAGYGLANLNLTYFFGAIYLFFINSVFIALATFLTVKYLRFPIVNTEDSRQERRRATSFALFVTIVIVPSVLSAVKVVKESNFNRDAAHIVAENKTIGKSYIYDYKTHLSTKPAVIELFMAGELMSDEQREQLYASAEQYGITRNQIKFREEASIENAPISDQEIIRSIYEQNEKRVQSRDETIASLEQELTEYKGKEIPVALITKELSAQYDNINAVILTRGQSASASSDEVNEEIVAIIDSSKPLSKDSQSKIENWLKIRLSAERVTVLNRQTARSAE